MGLLTDEEFTGCAQAYEFSLNMLWSLEWVISELNGDEWPRRLGWAFHDSISRAYDLEKVIFHTNDSGYVDFPSWFTDSLIPTDASGDNFRGTSWLRVAFSFSFALLELRQNYLEYHFSDIAKSASGKVALSYFKDNKSEVNPKDYPIEFTQIKDAIRIYLAEYNVFSIKNVKHITSGLEIERGLLYRDNPDLARRSLKSFCQPPSSFSDNSARDKFAYNLHLDPLKSWPIIAKLTNAENSDWEPVDGESARKAVDRLIQKNPSIYEKKDRAHTGHPKQKNPDVKKSELSDIGN